MKSFLLLITTALISNTLAMPISLEINVKKDCILSNKITVELVNNTTEVYYTWIDFNLVSSHSTKQQAAKQYFYSHLGDLTFGALLTDNAYSLGQFEPVAGISFLKKITPGEKFVYYIRMKGKSRKQLIKCILYLSEPELNRVIGTIANTNLLYKDDSLTIHFK